MGKMDRDSKRQRTHEPTDGAKPPSENQEFHEPPVPSTREDASDSESSSDEEGPMPAEATQQQTESAMLDATAMRENAKRELKRKKREALEKLHLNRLPSADLYEKSYMHRATVTHTLLSTACNFLVTASMDGQVMFWKIMTGGIHFVKTYQAHLEAITSLSKSVDERKLCTTATDKNVKIFDVLGFDMITLIEVEFVPFRSAWLCGDKSGSVGRHWIALSDRDSGNVFIVDPEADEPSVPLACVTQHRSPVVSLAYNSAKHCMISSDSSGVIEYWTNDGDLGKEFASPTPNDQDKVVSFRYKMDTDLFELCKRKTRALGMSVTKDGALFAITCADGHIEVFTFKTGKLKRHFDESLERVERLTNAGEEICAGIDSVDMGRRIAIEKQYLEKALSGEAPPSVAVFDESGTILILPCIVGVKFLSLATDSSPRVLGMLESSERFVSVSIYQGVPERDYQMQRALKGSDSKAIGASDASKELAVKEDPLIVCTAFSKPRFYLFTKRDPVDDAMYMSTGGRDVFNVKPDNISSGADGKGTGTQDVIAPHMLARQASIHTTEGDIIIELYPDIAPRTVENFATHAKKAYYEGVIFHRVIKDFMLQTGDPLGDGTGGESIWGGNFEDEINLHKLKHDRPYTVSMANSGPNTNGSQFFITTVSTPWLDGKHTVFGRVVRGMDVVTKIEQVKVDASDKPVEPIRILSIDTSFVPWGQ